VLLPQELRKNMWKCKVIGHKWEKDGDWRVCGRCKGREEYEGFLVPLNKGEIHSRFMSRRLSYLFKRLWPLWALYLLILLAAAVTGLQVLDYILMVLSVLLFFGFFSAAYRGSKKETDKFVEEAKKDRLV